MKKIVLLICILCTANAMAQKDTTKIEPKSKVTFKFGGRIDAAFFTDSYNSKDRGNGLQYMYPLAPVYNEAGEDINFQNRLRFNAASSRVSFTVGVSNLLGAQGTGYVEADFMGSAENVFTVLRLRHAYFRLDWKRQWVLFGQTSHMTMPEQMSAGTVLYGGGYPFNPLNRPVQAIFGQRIGRYSKFEASLAMFGGTTGQQQSYTMLPDMHVRFTFGNPDVLIFGVVAGVKFIKPRTLTENLSKATEQMTTFDAAIFMRYVFGRGHAVRLFGIWGQDLSPLSIIGGYAPLRDEYGTVQDYGYSPVSAYSIWADYETPQMKGWQLGLFLGLQQNLGTAKEVELTKASIPSQDIDLFYRVAPRLWYHYRKLSFGLEYTYTLATWAQQMNANYRPKTLYPNTFDNRVTLLARFKF